MSSLCSLLSATFAFALAACTAGDPVPPARPGTVDAPSPSMAAARSVRLTNTVWTWQSTQMKDGTRIVPDAPKRYALVFQPGGRINVRADCNRGSASYQFNGNALTFGPIALTKMMCPPESLDREFLEQLAAVAGQGMSGNDLVLTLKGDSGSMRFTTTR